MSDSEANYTYSSDQWDHSPDPYGQTQAHPQVYGPYRFEDEYKLSRDDPLSCDPDDWKSDGFPRSPTALDPNVNQHLRQWPGETVFGSDDIVIDCPGCPDFSCVAYFPLHLIMLISQFEALLWFRNHNLLYRSKLCEHCLTQVRKENDDPICVSRPCPGCKRQVFLGPPLVDAYNRFTVLQAFKTLLALPLRLTITAMAAIIGVTRQTTSIKIKECWIALADFHYIRSLSTKVDLAQADETVFGKRKYNRGKRVNNHLWFQTLVAVNDDGSTKDAYLRPVPNRKAVELIPWLKNLLSASATLVTDEFKSYSTVCTFAEHQTVCHKVEFTNAEGYHTNNAEGFHGILKREIATRGGKMGRGFVDRANYVVALAELISAEWRNMSKTMVIFTAFKRQIGSGRCHNYVATVVNSWPRRPIEVTVVSDDEALSEAEQDEEADEEEPVAEATSTTAVRRAPRARNPQAKKSPANKPKPKAQRKAARKTARQPTRKTARKIKQAQNRKAASRNTRRR